MNRHQIGAVVGALVLFCLLYFGFDTKPQKQKIIEKSRSENFENTSIDFLLTQAVPQLAPADQVFVEQKIKELRQDSTSNIQLLEELSGFWYRNGKYAIAGYYAEQIAETINDESSWSIAGTTYAQGIRSFDNEKERTFAANRAISSLEMAASMNPENLSHRVNLGICYADYPPADNPMKGIQILLDINKGNPEYVPALLALGRLAIQTGQLDRAMTRLEKVLTIEPERTEAYCLLAEAYKQVGKLSESESMLKKCNS